ncbi:MAG: hypothetical protein HPY69_07545 [Armatimonadetes bacterium]|nr:hypothetical protein [Armatimonadota bacterium]
MRLGDNPEIRKQLGGTSDGGASDGTKCPQCGGRKKPDFDLCYECSQKQRGGGQSYRGGSAGAPEPPSKLPPECVFDTFYGADGKLRPELFFVAAQRLADVFHESGLKKTQLRRMHSSLMRITAPIRTGRDDFDAAKEAFGIFYTERIVYQLGRGLIRPVVKEFFDKHRELVLSRPEEMLGLLQYLASLVCYFECKPDNERRSRA